MIELTAQEISDNLTAAQSSKLNELKALFAQKAKRPIVDTGLGYSVNGGYEDLTDFGIGREMALPQVRDVDNIFQTATDADYAAIITAIKTNGLLLKQNKWAHTDAINSLTTVQAVKEHDITAGW